MDQMTEAMIQIKDEIELKVYLKGQWIDVPIDQHSCFPCPYEEWGSGHGFMIQSTVLDFHKSGKDYEARSIHCRGIMGGGTKCQASMPFMIKRIRPKNT